MTEKDIYWLAGYLEGEGSFVKGTPSSPRSICIAVTTTDEDVAKRVSDLLGTKYHKVGNKRQKSHWKQAYRVQKRGEGTARLMLTLRPILSARRQQQIDKAIAHYSLPVRKGGVWLDGDLIWRIRADSMEPNMTHRRIADKYGIDQSTVSRIKNNESYRFGWDEELQMFKGDVINRNSYRSWTKLFANWKSNPNKETRAALLREENRKYGLLAAISYCHKQIPGVSQIIDTFFSEYNHALYWGKGDDESYFEAENGVSDSTREQLFSCPNLQYLLIKT